MTGWRRVVAREWLVAVGCLLAVFCLAWTGALNLRSDSDYLLLLALVYGAVQGLRLTAWAIGVLRIKGEK